MLFKKGQKVVCVDISIRNVWREFADLPEYRHMRRLIENEIYTIRGYDPQGGVFLEEIINRPSPVLRPGVGLIYREVSYFEGRFRSVDYSFGKQVIETLEIIESYG